jgi:AmiR/NasT family two-component response regulator
MTTWWEVRVNLVNDATAVVAAQNGCTPTEALAQLRVRAEATETDLEDVAKAVLALQILLDPNPVSVT